MEEDIVRSVAEFEQNSANVLVLGSPAFVLALYEPAGEAGGEVAVRSGDGGERLGILVLGEQRLD